MVCRQFLRGNHAQVGVNEEALPVPGKRGEKVIIQGGGPLPLVVKIIGGLSLPSQIVRVSVFLLGPGAFCLCEPDVFPDFFRVHGLIEISVDQQGLAQLTEAEAAAGPFQGAFARTVAVDDPFYPLGGDVLGVVHHFYQDESAVSAVGFVHVQHSVGGCAGPGEGVQDDGVFIIM